MNIFDKLKNAFTISDDIDLSRRRVIKTVGALAALTAVGGAVPLLSKVNELKQQIIDGQVYGQTFYITEPVVIDIPNVVISNCKFIAVNDMQYMLELGENARHCLIKDCDFHQKNNNINAAVYVAPQCGDMTTTMQSAIDVAANSDHKTLHLASNGIFKFQPKIAYPDNDGDYIGTKFEV